jgi:hypothetical protein
VEKDGVKYADWLEKVSDEEYQPAPWVE